MGLKVSKQHEQKAKEVSCSWLVGCEQGFSCGEYTRFLGGGQLKLGKCTCDELDVFGVMADRMERDLIESLLQRGGQTLVGRALLELLVDLWERFKRDQLDFLGGIMKSLCELLDAKWIRGPSL